MSASVFKHKIHLIAAVYHRDDGVLGIGSNNAQPVSIPEDMRFFRETTKDAPEGLKNVVIYGRKTVSSIPEKFRTMPGRILCVVGDAAQTSKLFENLPVEQGTVMVGFKSVEGALHWADQCPLTNEIFIGGGSRIYEEGLQFADDVILTHVYIENDRTVYDALFPSGWEKFVDRKTSLVAKEDSKFETKDGQKLSYSRVIYPAKKTQPYEAEGTFE